MTSYAVDRERWSRMDILNQMGNIGSEVGRAIDAKRRGDESRMRGAIARALDLFDATVECLVAQRSPRVREVLRAREQFAKLFFGNNLENDFRDAESLERYFTWFAAAARA